MNKVFEKGPSLAGARCSLQCLLHISVFWLAVIYYKAMGSLSLDIRGFDGLDLYNNGP